MTRTWMTTKGLDRMRVSERRDNRDMNKLYMTRPTKRRRRTKAEIAAIRQAIWETLNQVHPMTVRQTFYQLSVKHVIEKLESEYKGTVCRLLVKMREDNEIPFEWISDNTRWMRKPRTHSSFEQALRNTAQTYRRALWENQDAYVEIWTEKDAIAGIILEETKPWDVPLMVSRGFSSITYLYEAAQAILAQNKPAYLYYFGDHDPSGVVIDRKIEQRLRQFAPDADIVFKRIGVTPEQIEAWELPTRPTKKTDSRRKNFSGTSVEVDAIPALKLRELVRDCIEQHVNEHQLHVTTVAEKSERKLGLALANWLEEKGKRHVLKTITSAG